MRVIPRAALAFSLPILFFLPGLPLRADAAETETPEWDVSNPPGYDRTITIDTTETTWSSLDVSPDGSTMVFDMLGDIYSMPIDGGEATALTNGIEWSYQPRFSPDGSEIVFVSDRKGANNLWLMDADGGNPRQITEETEHALHNPAWSPDGRYVVAKKDFTSTRSIPGAEIWAFHKGGGSGMALVERPHGDRDQKSMAEPAFSPDGRYLYFSQDTTSGRLWEYSKDSTGQIFVIQRFDTEKGETEVLAGGPGGAVRPTPSPDGKTLAFVKRLDALTSAIYLRDLVSGREWPIVREYERDNQESAGEHGNAPAFAWTPDSASIVYWSDGGFHRVDVADGTIVDIPVHVRTEMKIRPALRMAVEVAPDTFRIRMPRWVQMSPASDQIVFQALGHLYAQNGSTGTPRRLTSQTDHFEFHPSFSRDGRWIVYTTWDDQELGSVRVVPATGGASRAVTTTPGHYVEPRFSPDGTSIVFRKIAGGFLLSPLWSADPGIYIVATSGGTPERISKSGFNAHFGARGDRVFFSDSVDFTQMALKSVDTRGQEERTHAQGAKVTELQVSPDGQWIAFIEQYDTYVAPFAALGRKESVGQSMKANPVRRVSRRSGEFLHWSGDSKTLRWANGSTLYARDLKDAFSFVEGGMTELPEPVSEGLEIELEVTADKPSGAIVLTGGRVVTMRDADNTQEIIEDGVVVVEGNRIVAVGPAGSVEVPAGAFTLDVAGKTVLPGLLDMHAHGAFARTGITPQQNWGQYANLAFGVTTLHDPSNETSSVFAAAEMQRAGRTVAPRIFSTGMILYGAHSPGATASVESLDDARFHVRRLQDVGAISVKSYQQPRRDQRQKIIAAAAELGMMVVPEGGMKFQHNMNMLVDGHTGIEHSLPIKEVYDDVYQLWSQTEVGYTPTFVVAFGGISGEHYWYEHTNVWENEKLMTYTPRRFVEPRSKRRTKAPESHYNHIHVAQTAKHLRDRGVPVHIGAHGQRHGLAAHWELWMMQQGGFTPWEALRGGTIDGAKYVGLDADLGSIELGKLADLIVIDGDPLTDIRDSELVVYTMLNGRLFDTATMNEIGNHPRAREPFFFQREASDSMPESTATWLSEFERRYLCAH